MHGDESRRQLSGIDCFECISHFTEQRFIDAVVEANAAAAAVAF